MEATLLRHDHLQSEIEALEGRLQDGTRLGDALETVQVLLHWAAFAVTAQPLEAICIIALSYRFQRC